MARLLAIALRQARRAANGLGDSPGERPLHVNGPTLCPSSGRENVKCAQGSRKVGARLQSARHLRLEQRRLRPHTSAVARQELDAELALEAWTLLAQRWLRDEQSPHGSGELELSCNRDEVPEIAQLPGSMRGAASADGLLRAAAAREALAATSSQPCGNTLARSS
jgi:hypothetical protein